MNKLIVGFNKKVEPPKRGLFIHDDVPDISRARIFDPTKHSFNPLKDIDYRKARALADLIYTIYPQGENTLKVREGRWSLLPALLAAKRLDDVDGNEEVQGVLGDLLQSPVLKRVLCSNANQFSFNPNSLILARINRAELGDFDALVLGLFLIEQFKGQVVVPDFGFYGRETHVSLIRETRLVAGVNFLGELAPRLRNATLLIKDREASGALFDDAVVLVQLAGLRPDPSHDDNPYNRFIDQAMG